jgi:hypothetical protein
MPSPSLHAGLISEEQKPAPISVPLPTPNAPPGHRIAEEHHKEKPI